MQHPGLCVCSRPWVAPEKQLNTHFVLHMSYVCRLPHTSSIKFCSYSRTGDKNFGAAEPSPPKRNKRETLSRSDWGRPKTNIPMTCLSPQIAFAVRLVYKHVSGLTTSLPVLGHSGYNFTVWSHAIFSSCVSAGEKFTNRVAKTRVITQSIRGSSSNNVACDAMAVPPPVA